MLIEHFDGHRKRKSASMDICIDVPNIYIICTKNMKYCDRIIRVDYSSQISRVSHKSTQYYEYANIFQLHSVLWIKAEII